ncbi:MAG TPA: hypothetical protein VNO26_04140 [Candidatus Limnocylindria bacterium]|nr:hypothetical protein [Candidatus Limnocylindria bacterium]
MRYAGWRALLATLVIAGAGVSAAAHVRLPVSATAGDVRFDDPAPAGISYEWTVSLAKRQTAELVRFVGALAWNEPSQPVGAKGWTHWSDWVALELAAPATVKIVVTAQQGVVGPAGLMRSALVPAVSLYDGWDETTENEAHTYNAVGNFWAAMQYLASAANEKGRSVVTLKRKLPAGRYSIAIGGNPPSLGGASAYPTSDCDPADEICYRYTGFHGYRAKITAK